MMNSEARKRAQGFVSSTDDRVTVVMVLARRLADEQVRHHDVIEAYANDLGDLEWTDVEASAWRWTEAEKALRDGIAEVLS